MRTLLRIPFYVWASPWTLFGIFFGLLAILSGGGGRRVGGILEFHGGVVRWLLERFPYEPIALTLGHTVLGRTTAALDVARDHELVHVRQYEIWGPLFVPAYFFASFVVWLQGKNPYYDNPFEREAYGTTG